MENTKQNPLSKYFRQPAIYMKLPSNGQYWAEGAVELPVTGEIPVYPMTAKDEVTIRTPDALMNGTSVVTIIESCCPSIKDAWKMPSVDVDAVLIGIRIASYGAAMNIDTKCPHCSEENAHDINLTGVLDGLGCPDYTQKIEAHDLKIKVRPQEFFEVNKRNVIAFEEQRLVDALGNSALSAEDRTTQIVTSMDKLVELGISTVTQSTESIELADGTLVTDTGHISEFYSNTDGNVVRQVQSHLAKMANEYAIKPQKVSCSECQKTYDVPLEFDYANFFAAGS